MLRTFRHRIYFAKYNCFEGSRIITRRSGTKPKSELKLIQYSQLPLSKNLVKRLKQPLCKRSEFISSTSIPEDILLPLFLKPKNFLPSEKNDKGMQYIIHDDILNFKYHYTFLLPLVNYLFYDEAINLSTLTTREQFKQFSGPKAIIITPTKELVNILYDACISLLPEQKDIQKVVSFGLSKNEDFSNPKLFNQAKIVISTSDALNSIISASEFSLHEINNVIIHCANILTENDNHSSEIGSLLSQISDKRSILLFTNQITEKLIDFSKLHLHKRWWINLIPSTNSITPSNPISYKTIQINEHNRIECIKKIINIHHKKKTIIFINSIELLEDAASHVSFYIF